LYPRIGNTLTGWDHPIVIELLSLSITVGVIDDTEIVGEAYPNTL